MPSLPSKLIFPSCCLTEIETRDEFSTVITPSNGAEASNALWAFPRFVVSLSGGIMTREQHREIKAVNRLLKGRRTKFWFRRYGDPEWELLGADGKGEFLVEGDGVRNTFQARIYDVVQGKPVWLPVYALDHDIEPLGKTAYGLAATETRYVEVFLNGALQKLGVHYNVERETGRIIFVAPPAKKAVVKLRCGFFAVMRLNQESIPTMPAGAGQYRVADNVLLIEPKGQGSLLEAA